MRTKTAMWIGELSQRSGASRDTIRYYEKLQLLATCGRNASGTYKTYGMDALVRLRQIKRLQSLGFSLTEIRSLLGLEASIHPCRTLPADLEQKVAKIDQQIATLMATREMLLRVAARCDSQCDTSSGLPHCVSAESIIELPRKSCC